LLAIQSAFIDFLSENNGKNHKLVKYTFFEYFKLFLFINFIPDVVQDIAAKGLYLTYTSCPDKDKPVLVSALTTELLHGRLEVRQSSDTESKKSAEKNDAGKSSTG